MNSDQSQAVVNLVIQFHVPQKGRSAVSRGITPGLSMILLHSINYCSLIRCAIRIKGCETTPSSASAHLDGSCAQSASTVSTRNYVIQFRRRLWSWWDVTMLSTAGPGLPGVHDPEWQKGTLSSPAVLSVRWAPHLADPTRLHMHNWAAVSTNAASPWPQSHSFISFWRHRTIFSIFPRDNVERTLNFQSVK
jgi:hypothetical protein